MRIACIHLPSFPLQAHIRQAPHLAGTAVAVARESEIACASRAALAAGARPGMRLSAARALCPALAVVRSGAHVEARAAAAAGDVLRSLADDVEQSLTASGLSFYMNVPRGMRGIRFGETAVALLARQGLRARAGVADDRFTAYVAAAGPRDGEAGAPPPVALSVPRGGSAAFLAPYPLWLLPMEPDVKAMLCALGVRTLGEFAALPPPSIARPSSSSAFDLQDLARGEGPAIVRANVTGEAITERIELATAVGDPEPLGFGVRPVADRIAGRLRARNAAAIELAISVGDGAPWVHDVAPTASHRTLLDAICAVIAARGRSSISALQVTVTRTVAREEDEALLLPGLGVLCELGGTAASTSERQREGSRSRSRRRTARPRTCTDAGETGARSNDSAW